jgi:transglutaminase-like putative cysteine protease
MTAAQHFAHPVAPVQFGSSRRTVRALIASALGVLPLCELFTDRRWLLEVWLAMLITVAPAAVLRLRGRPRVSQTWLGLAAVAIWLTAHYLPRHALAGLLPSTATWHDLSALMTSVHGTTTSGVAPVHTTFAIKFILAAMLALLAALVDLVAVVGRRGALAGVPLLVVYTVSGAVPRHPVSWPYFISAGVGFLLLLSIDADDEVRGWGRFIPRAGDSRASTGLAVSGPRIAVIALAVAVIVPLLAPSQPTNVIADALHKKGGSGGGGSGFGAGGGISLDAFDSLKGDLLRSKAVNLFTVTLDTAPAVQPFYLRANVLTNYSDRGWSAGRHGSTENIDATFFGTTPPTSSLNSTASFTARLSISGLGDNPPVFSRPVSVSGIDGAARWSREDELLVGTRVHKGQHITEQIAQPTPSSGQLEAAPADYPADLAADSQVPADMPLTVSSLVARLTRGLTSPYAKARAMSDYFTNPASGYTYSLTTRAGDSGSDLVDFLTNKAGFCQQYAGAMGIMLRMAGVPARVVLGYTHPRPDRNASFTVTTNDAHAWVEAYFDGLGWIPFDPTPDAGVAGGSKVDLPWAPHPQSAQSGGPANSASGPKATSTKRAAANLPEGAASAGSAGTRSGDPWPVGLGLITFAVLCGIGLVPALARWRRRRHRLLAAGGGDPDPLWAELSDTAVDLGYVWSAARSPRQVAGWLAPQVDAPAAQSLRTLASAVERARYAPGDLLDEAHSLVGELRTIEARLRAERSRAARIAARLLPASLGWRRLRIAVPRRKRR